jgi:hypothetical protein
MTTGALIFARNNDQIDYKAMALLECQEYRTTSRNTHTHSHR